MKIKFILVTLVCLYLSEILQAQCVPQAESVCGTTITECKTVADLIGPDRNQFQYCCASPAPSPSEGYLHNFTIPSPASCSAPTVTSAIVEINTNTVTLTDPNGYTDACGFFSVFGNVYYDAGGTLTLTDNSNFNYLDVNTPGDDGFGTGACAGGGTCNYSACADLTLTDRDNGIPDYAASPDYVIVPGGTIGVDIIPAFSWVEGNSPAATNCENFVNGQAITQALVDVDYEICITYVFDNVVPEVSAQVDNSATICDGGLTTEITDWQNVVAADATIAAASASCSATLVYSSVAVPADAAVHDDLTANGIHSGICDVEDQLTYAYLLCNGVYSLVGTHTLTTIPQYDIVVVEPVCDGAAGSAEIQVGGTMCSSVAGIAGVSNICPDTNDTDATLTYDFSTDGNIMAATMAGCVPTGAALSGAVSTDCAVVCQPTCDAVNGTISILNVP